MRHDNIYNRFAARVASISNRIAVTDECTSMTYGELACCAATVADALASESCQPGDVVAVATRRDCQTIASILGILKAGCAYLPIDPEQPAERLNQILSVAGAKALVGLEAVIAELPGPQLRRIANRPVSENLASDPMACQPAPNGIAYVLFTSGTTGVPKGALNRHEALHALTDNITALWRLSGSGHANVALVAPFIFDASLQQIVPTLLEGHRLYLVPEYTRRDGHALAAYLADNKIDFVDGTPMHLKLLTKALETNDSLSIAVKHYLIGGEELTTAVVREFFERAAPSRPSISNMYGVAECGVNSVCHTFGADGVGAEATVSLGRALSGSTVKILDENLREVSFGQTGEICFVGACVGAGYVGAPDLTAERFVQFEDGRETIYRTGDIGTIDSGGVVRFHGRRDRQVKLRGVRIELGDVESVFREFGENAESQPDSEWCARCVLPSDYPGATLGDEGVCAVCREYEGIADAVKYYFRTEDDLRKILIGGRTRKARSGPDDSYDCMLLYSGGKDSTYALCKLVEAGFRVLAYTFDNGFISEAALENARRMTETLGVDHRVGTTEDMNSVFRASLATASTVCAGCFRGLSAQSTQLAIELGISVIVSGLSRGQIFDTKLKRLYKAGETDIERIEAQLREHRAFYHSKADPITRVLQIEDPKQDELARIEFVDYFRYDDATVSEVKSFLAQRGSVWKTPKDTGTCSTNCRINNVGIFVHQQEKGHHNYLEPLAWDCRLGVVERWQALEELNARPAAADVSEILDELGYQPRERSAIRDVAVVIRSDVPERPYLAAYYVADQEVDGALLRDHVSRRLPSAMIPARIEWLPALPTQASGKVDYAALAEKPAPSVSGNRSARTETEEFIACLWCEVLEIQHVDADVDFALLGGDSLSGTVLIAMLESEFGVQLSMNEVFARATVSGMAALLDQRLDSKSGGSAPEAKASTTLLRAASGGQGNVLFLPGYGDDVRVFRHIADALPAGIGAYGVTMEVRHRGSMAELLDDLFEVAAALPGPRVLVGWSFGGVVACALENRLADAGLGSTAVIALDSASPEPEFWRSEFREVEAFLLRLGIEAGALRSTIAQLVRERWTALHGVPEFIRQVFPVGSTINAPEVAQYVHRALPALQLLAEKGLPIRVRSPLHLVRASRGLAQPQKWAFVAQETTLVHDIVGDHYSILTGSAAEFIASTITQVTKSQGEDQWSHCS